MPDATLTVTLAALIGLGVAGPAWSADLPPRDRPVIRSAPPRPLVYRAAPYDYYEGLGPPASQHGYYGYYGFDIAGTPYEGLYSADVLCLRSIPTRYGYRTVNVCR